MAAPFQLLNMMMDPMDVDPTISTSSSSSEIYPELDLTNSERDNVAAEMNSISNACYWKMILEASDSKGLGCPDEISAGIFTYFTEVLGRIAVKSSIIACPTPQRAMEILKGFNEKESKSWAAGVRSGVLEGDWDDLIQLRMYFLDSQTIKLPLIVTTAKLRIPKMRKVALGVPIEQSALHCCPFNFAMIFTSHSFLSWPRERYASVNVSMT